MSESDLYTSEDIEEALNDRGELLLQLESDGYPSPVELHLHDTEFFHSVNEIVLQLSDGQFAFKASRVEGLAIHQQSTSDLGL